MGVTVRAAQAITGPAGGTVWIDSGGPFQIPAIASVTTSTTTNAYPAQTITRRVPFYMNTETQAQTYQDFLMEAASQTRTIQALYGFQVASSVGFAATSTLQITMSVVRAIGTIGSTFVAGTVTSIPLALPLFETLPSGTNINVYHTTTSPTTITTTVSNPVGATSITIPSTSLSGNAIGDVITWIVGNNNSTNANGFAFGWTNANSLVAGTPFFPPGVSVVAPYIPTSSTNTTPLNTSVISSNQPSITNFNNGITAGFGGIFGGTTSTTTGFLTLQPGDLLVVLVNTSSSTVSTFPATNIQPLII